MGAFLRASVVLYLVVRGHRRYIPEFPSREGTHLAVDITDAG